MDARKEVLLQGELLRKYHEQYMDKPMASDLEQQSFYKEAFRQQMEALKGELRKETSDGEALKARNRELETMNMKHEETINDLKRQSKKLCVSSLGRSRF